MALAARLSADYQQELMSILGHGHVLITSPKPLALGSICSVGLELAGLSWEDPAGHYCHNPATLWPQPPASEEFLNGGGLQALFRLTVCQVAHSPRTAKILLKAFLGQADVSSKVPETTDLTLRQSTGAQDAGHG